MWTKFVKFATLFVDRLVGPQYLPLSLSEIATAVFDGGYWGHRVEKLEFGPKLGNHPLLDEAFVRCNAPDSEEALQPGYRL